MGIIIIIIFFLIKLVLNFSEHDSYNWCSLKVRLLFGVRRRNLCSGNTHCRWQSVKCHFTSVVPNMQHVALVCYGGLGSAEMNSGLWRTWFVPPHREGFCLIWAFCGLECWWQSHQDSSSSKIKQASRSTEYKSETIKKQTNNVFDHIKPCYRDIPACENHPWWWKAGFYCSQVLHSALRDPVCSCPTVTFHRLGGKHWWGHCKTASAGTSALYLSFTLIHIRWMNRFCGWTVRACESAN